MMYQFFLCIIMMRMDTKMSIISKNMNTNINQMIPIVQWHNDIVPARLP